MALMFVIAETGIHDRDTIFSSAWTLR